MKFKKYQHVEKLGTAATDGILDGTCYVFPKILLCSISWSLPTPKNLNPNCFKEWFLCLRLLVNRILKLNVPIAFLIRHCPIIATEFLSTRVTTNI